jgi:Tfp pilus assembly protein PilO
VIRRGPLIAAGVGALVVVLVIALMIVPKLSEIHRTNDQLAAARQQQGNLESQLAQLKATQERAKAISTELALLDAAVPPEQDLPDLIRMLNDAADQSGVTFMTVAPSQPVPVAGAASGGAPAPGGSTSAPPTPQPGGALQGTGLTSLPEGISVLPMSITVEGTYFAVDEYLFRLESLPRISKVTTITLGLGGLGYPQLSLAFTVNFYTTDVSAGPGSQQGSQTIGGIVVPPSPTPSPSTSSTATATPSGVSPGGTSPSPSGP